MILERCIHCKIVKMLEKMKVCRREVRIVWWMRYNFDCVTLATCERTLLWRRIRPFLLTKAGCFSHNFLCISSNCWQCPFSLCQVTVVDYFLLVHHTVTMHFFWWNSDFRRCFGASFLSSHWALRVVIENPLFITRYDVFEEWIVFMPQQQSWKELVA